MNLSSASITIRSLLLAPLLIGALACGQADKDADAGDSPAGMSGTGGKGGTGDAGDGTGGKPPVAATPTWTEVYTTIITGCVGAQCHTSASSGNLVMGSQQGTYDVLVDVDAMGEKYFDPTTGGPMATPACKDSGLKRIAPGDPDKSLVVQKVGTSPPCGARMPIGQPLTDDQIKKISDWVKAGAKND